MEYVADKLKSQGRRIMYAESQWFEYKNGVWVTWTAEDKRLFGILVHRLAKLHEFAWSTSTSSVEVTLQAEFGADHVVEWDATPMVVGRNKTYDLSAGHLLKHSPEHYATRSVDFDIDPDAECPLWLDMLDRIWSDHDDKSRTEHVQFLQEWMGIALVGARHARRDLRKGVFLTGLQRTGKSSISDTLEYLLGGKKRIACPSIADLSTEFGLQTLLGKSALITNEAAGGRRKGSAEKLKKLITGDSLNVNRKNLPPVEYSWHGPVIFTTNNLPKMDEEGSAFYGRCVILRFTRQFDADDADRDLRGYHDVVTMLREEGEMAGILNWAMEGYDRAIARGRFVIPKAAESAGQEFQSDNDPVFDFLKSCVEYDKASACASAAVYIACVEWALAQHDQKLSLISARQRIPAQIREVHPGVLIGRWSVKGEQTRSFAKMRLNDNGLAMLKQAAGKAYPDLARANRAVNYKYG